MIESPRNLESEARKIRLAEYLHRISGRNLKYFAKDFRAFEEAYGRSTALSVMLRPRGLISLTPPGLDTEVAIRANSSDIPTFRQVYLSRHYDIDLGFEPNIIIDAGANAGYSTVFFATKYPQAQIVSIEPEQYNFLLLERNTSSLPQVRLELAALWPESRSLCIANPQSDYWGFQVRESVHENTIQGISLQDLFERYRLDTVDLVKLDIEGAEVPLFKGNLSWTNNVRAVYIETHESIHPGSTAEIREKLTGSGFIEESTGHELLFVK